MSVFILILESLVLALTCSLDAFTATFAYGSGNIKIPWQSGQIINFVCVSFLGIALCIGSAVRHFLPLWLTIGAAFTVLFISGLTKLLDSLTRSLIRRHNRTNRENLNKELRFSLFNFSFILNLYANPEEADINVDKIISPKEAAALAASLSFDGLAVGFGAALGNINIPAVLTASLFTNTLAVFAGSRLGESFARKLPFDASWLSGGILIALAVFRLVLR